MYSTDRAAHKPTYHQLPTENANMNKLTLLALFGVLALTAAWCPNGCSGHGTCRTSPKDSCLCYKRREWAPTGYGAWSVAGGSAATNSEVPAWQGADCSERTCPAGRAWAASPQKDNDHTQLIECSGRGICDRKSGVCACFTGYWGEGCRRSECPNGCSGHGICQDLKRTASDNSAQYADAWDSKMNYGCTCDAGFRGPDCSMIECPSTSDVLGGEGNERGRDCSGRGICDYGTGVCTCFSGYKGTRCEAQTVMN